MRVIRAIVLTIAVTLMTFFPVTPASATQTSGTTPVSIRIPQILVNTAIQPLQIPGGRMEEPGGTWVVGWYDETAGLGQADNTVVYGYRDFENVGPSVFYFLDQLSEGNLIEVTGADGIIYSYQVSSMQSYDVATVPLNEIFGPTGDERLTLFTFGLPRDQNLGTYQTILVVQATRHEEHAGQRSDEALNGEGGADCTLAPRELNLPGGSIIPIFGQQEARESFNLPGAEVTDPSSVESIEAFLNEATDCDMAVREALTLPDGSILTLLGPAGQTPLNTVVAAGGYSPIATHRAATVMEFVLFIQDGDSWTVEPVPWN